MRASAGRGRNRGPRQVGMMRLIDAILPLTLCLGAVASQSAKADPQAIGGLNTFDFANSEAPDVVGGRAGYGGGFVEFVLTGRSRAPGYGVHSVALPKPVKPVALAVAARPSESELEVQGETPAQFRRQEVDYATKERPGAIIIDTPNKYLYLVLPGGRAVRYGIGVGRPGFEWSGVKSVTRKAEWPAWTPPPEMLKRRPDLPRHMDGGLDNPLGARALYLGSSEYRIHGTNEPTSIGLNMSSGCIRMMNKDVIDLFNRVPVGTKVVVI